jgi:hypothetical protein
MFYVGPQKETKQENTCQNSCKVQYRETWIAVHIHQQQKQVGKANQQARGEEKQYDKKRFHF